MGSTYLQRQGRPSAGVSRGGRQPSSYAGGLLQLQRAVGNRATTMILQRWLQPTEKSAPPDPVKSLRRQPDGVRWDDNRKDPRAAYRFVDAQDRGWEAAGHDQPFKYTDWHKALAKATELAEKAWYNVTDRKWVSGAAPGNEFREALAQERPELSKKLHGYPSSDQVPMYVRVKYRRKPGRDRAQRPADLRSLDRTARLLMQDIPETSTPHLATGVVGQVLTVAGNTGARRVTAEQAAHASQNLGAALNPALNHGRGTRKAKDSIKLRALLSGDYRAHHRGADAGLRQLETALQSPPAWRNVDVDQAGAEHGEMTLLADLHGQLAAAPHHGKLIDKHLGGVKLACGACQLAFQAYNQFIAKGLGYRVVVSGTHGGFYNGWRMPDVVWNNASARAHVIAGITAPAYIDDQGVLRGVEGPGAGYHDPEESDSEWEEA